MDELDLVAGLRADLAPSSETVARHRGAFRAAINGEARVVGGGHDTVVRDDQRPADPAVLDLAIEYGSDTGRGHRPGRGVAVVAAAAAAAAVVVLVGMALAVPRTGGSDGRRVVASSQEDGESPVSQVSGGAARPCGSELPIAVPVPDDFAGPANGPGGDALTAPAPDQVVRHWIADRGTIEVRWPGDMSRDEFPDGGDFVVELTDRGALVTDVPNSADLVTQTIVSEVEQTPVGGSAIWLEIASPVVGDGACQTLQVTVAGQDEASAREMASQLSTRLRAPGGPFGGPVVSLVTGSTLADAPPDAGRCENRTVPNKGGPVTDLGLHATPADALLAFVGTQTMTTTDSFGIEVTQPTIAESGYTEITLPDGSIAYAHQAREDFVGVVIHVTQVEGGWTVDRWEASGC